MVEWSRKPKINGHRLDAAIRVSNQTGDDFDFTVIALAVNENGRATAVGYQHFTLKKDTDEFEIPFGENLPRGVLRPECGRSLLKWHPRTLFFALDWHRRGNYR